MLKGNKSNKFTSILNLLLFILWQLLQISIILINNYYIFKILVTCPLFIFLCNLITLTII